MSSINPKKALFLTAALLLSSCSQQLPPLPESVETVPDRVATLPDNRVCNHTFDSAQRSLQPNFEETETNSIVRGETFADLMKSLRSDATYRGQGNTRWTINWSFDSRRSAVGCFIDNVETTVDVNYHFPIWSDQLVVSNRTLADQWGEYSDALRTHHCKHGKTGIDASLEVGSRLRQLLPARSCDELVQEADNMARKVIEVFRLVESGFTPPNILDYIKR